MTLTMNAATDASTLLRRVLHADGIVCAAMGALLTLAAAPLAGLLGLPAPLLRVVGISLLPLAAVLIYLATRAAIPRRGVWAVIAYDVLWVADSILLLVTGWVEPTALGYAFVIGQALVVAGFAELKYVGLRRAP
ncbi:MAG TPA: hypothetical protein VD978_14015 [Azospirillum sp.]|nr:hypothetical protein [Azospirillum sp.]